MSFDMPIERAVREIREMSREQCILELINFQGLRLDFDRSFLESFSDDRLRHLLLAAVLRVTKRRVA
jgi:hypothetical protein